LQSFSATQNAMHDVITGNVAAPPVPPPPLVPAEPVDPPEPPAPVPPFELLQAPNARTAASRATEAPELIDIRSSVGRGLVAMMGMVVVGCKRYWQAVFTRVSASAPCDVM
jgi:hypothetical protein